MLVFAIFCAISMPSNYAPKFNVFISFMCEIKEATSSLRQTTLNYSKENLSVAEFAKGSQMVNVCQVFHKDIKCTFGSWYIAHGHILS